MHNTLTLNLPNIRQISLKTKFNLKIFWVLNFVLVILLLTFYIFYLNLIFTETNLIKNYEKKLDEIAKENKNLEISSVKSNSLGGIDTQIEEKFNELGFEKVNQIHYIRALESTVASINKSNE